MAYSLDTVGKRDAFSIPTYLNMPGTWQILVYDLCLEAIG